MLATLIKFEEIVAMIFLAAIVLFVFIAAIMRSFGYPLIWSVDMAQLLFVWVCMLGANQALRKGEHVGVDFLVRRLSERHRFALDIFLYLIIAGLLVILVIYGVELSLLNPQRTLGSTSLPYALVTAAIPAGASLMLITVISKISCFLRHLKSAETNP